MGSDSLAIKAAHSESHQLPLSDHPRAREEFAKQLNLDLSAPEANRIHKQLAFPGFLFYPWQKEMPTPLGANTEHYQGYWLPINTWPDLVAELPNNSLGSLLTKPRWLAPPLKEQLKTLDELSQAITSHFNQVQEPVQLAIRSSDGLWVRIFIVGPSWPLQIPLPPTHRKPNFV